MPANPAPTTTASKCVVLSTVAGYICAVGKQVDEHYPWAQILSSFQLYEKRFVYSGVHTPPCLIVTEIKSEAVPGTYEWASR